MQRFWGLGISFGMICLPFTLLAQPSNYLGTSGAPKAGMANNPLSRIGIGDLNYNSNSFTKGMGGIATAYNNPYALNVLNPATYAFVKNTTFDFSVNAYSNNIFINDENLKSSTYTLGSLGFAIPMGKYFGMSFGFNPRSSIYYNAQNTGILPDGDTVRNYYYGFGGIQNVYLGAAFKYKGFALGANAHYLFGNHRNSSSIELSSTSEMNSEFINYNRIRGFQFNLGAVYQHVFNQKYYVHVGATYDLKAQLNSFQDQYAMAYNYSLVQSKVTTSPVDTLHNYTQLNQKGSLQLPSSYSFGLHVGKSGFWNVGVDYRGTQWKEYNYNGDRDNIAASTYRFGLGGELTPNPEALKNKFLNNTTFRAGAYFGSDYTIAGGNQLKYFGGTFGVGLPLFRAYNSNSRGIVNLSFDIGRTNNQNPTNATQFTNSFVKFNLGFNINDVWFIKRKFD